MHLVVSVRLSARSSVYRSVQTTGVLLASWCVQIANKNFRLGSQQHPWGAYVCLSVWPSELSCLNHKIWSKGWSLPVRGFCL